MSVSAACCSRVSLQLQRATKANTKMRQSAQMSSDDSLMLSSCKEDPLIPFLSWTLDNPCPVPASSAAPPQAECKLLNFPTYVVNVTTTKDVQMAVNFARNNNIRLTIK